jgi:hypothetical protein
MTTACGRPALLGGHVTSPPEASNFVVQLSVSGRRCESPKSFRVVRDSKQLGEESAGIWPTLLR